ncbi:MAG: hypothetical protein PHD33_02125 [Atribacterota bacterium]|nr:hypothetical protein [Atribacterota bacterium]
MHVIILSYRRLLIHPWASPWFSAPKGLIKKITKYTEDYGVLLNGEHSKLKTNLKGNDIIDLFYIIDDG